MISTESIIDFMPIIVVLIRLKNRRPIGGETGLLAGKRMRPLFCPD